MPDAGSMEARQLMTLQVSLPPALRKLLWFKTPAAYAADTVTAMAAEISILLFLFLLHLYSVPAARVCRNHFSIFRSINHGAEPRNETAVGNGLQQRLSIDKAEELYTHIEAIETEISWLAPMNMGIPMSTAPAALSSHCPWRSHRDTRLAL